LCWMTTNSNELQDSLSPLRCSTPMRPCRSPISSSLSIPVSPPNSIPRWRGARACPSHDPQIELACAMSA
jgi:hypothetical protein